MSERVGEMKIVLFLLALLLPGCTKWAYVEPQVVPQDTMLYQDSQMCVLHSYNGQRYFVFSSKKENDICELFR